MLDSTLIALFIIAGLLIVYHHAVFPVLLKKLTKNKQTSQVTPNKRGFLNSQQDEMLPSVSLVIPAYNEEEWITEKILNLSFLDYPSDRLSVYIACDGCTDNTVAKARLAAAQLECHDLNIDIIDFTENEGKVAVLNKVIEPLNSDLIALSDVSALISTDGLLMAVEHFKQADIGVVTGHYQLLNPGSESEQAYWQYQSDIKKNESKLASTLGTHGAFYLFRKNLFTPLPGDTINDDFIIPMNIVAQGYRAIYDENINILEMEQATDSMDHSRRRRIAAGNMQQLIRLKKLVNPKFGSVSLMFTSGKALRVMVPFLMVIAWLSSAVLAFSYVVFLILFILQSLIYSYGLVCHYLHKTPKNRYLKLINYLISGHYAGLIGSVKYLLGLSQKRWHKV